MSGPQIEDGYTRIANELLEALCLTRIPGESMQIFLTILRKTYGFGKKTDSIALSQLVAATGIVKTHISRAVLKLENMNMIVTQKGNFNGTTYGINKNYHTWESLPKKVMLPKKVIKVTLEGNLELPKKVHTKERFKERKKESFTVSERFQKTFDWFWKAYALEEGRGRSGNKKKTLEKMTKTIKSDDDALRFCFAVKEYFRQVDEENESRQPDKQRALKLPEVFTNEWQGYIPEDADARLAHYKEAQNAKEAI